MALIALLVLVPAPAHAYIGPGAGVSLLGALFGIFSMLGLFVWSLMKWAFRSTFRRKTAMAAGPANASTPASGTLGTPGTGGDESTAPLQQTAASMAAAPKGDSASGPTNAGLILVALSMLLAGVSLATFSDYPRDTLLSWRVAAGHVLKGFRDPLVYNHWHRDRFPTHVQGVITHDTSAAQPGLNLETTATLPSTRLLNMEGEVVHEWRQGREAMARAWAAMGEPRSDLSGLHWRRVKPLSDGSLIVIVENNRTTPYGFGLMKLDAGSQISWMTPGHYHHSLDIADDGRIFVLYQELTEQSHPLLPRVMGPILLEGVAVLTADGKEIRRYDIVEAFRGTPYEAFLKDVRQDDRGDPLHLNTVTLIDAEVAATTPFAREGQLLLSMRNTSTIAILDPETGKITWAVNDLWTAQHEPVLTGHGKLLLFDNLGQEGVRSRAIEWDMTRQTIEWSWDGTDEAPLLSEQYGSIQLLANGNRLISETYGGRAIEVTPSGEVVWEWRSPFREEGPPAKVGRLMEMMRLPSDFFEPGALASSGNREWN